MIDRATGVANSGQTVHASGLHLTFGEPTTSAIRRRSLASRPMIYDPWFYAAAVPAMIALGLAKGGFSAIGFLVVPIMAITISPITAAGITLPIMIISDIVALVLYRNAFDGRTLVIMLPGALLGILIGWLAAAWVNEDLIRLIVGLLAVLFSLSYWLSAARRQAPASHDARKGVFWGTVAGFTSFVSHAGGPPYQMYVAPLRLSPTVFAGTHVIMFAVMNTVKVVPFFMLGQLSATSLSTSAVLLTVSVPMTFAGAALVRRFETAAYYRLVYALMLLVGIYLIADAFVSIF